MGVELGRLRLLLPPPPPPRRLGEEGGGRPGRGGGWVLLCNFSPGASARRQRLQTRPPRRCGGGGPAGTRLPPARSMYAPPTPSWALPSPKPLQRACQAGRPALSAAKTLRHRFRATLSPALSDTLRATRRGTEARTTPAPLLRPRPAPLAVPLSSPRALAAIAAEGQGELPNGSGVAELGGGGKEAEEKLEKLSFPPKRAPERLGLPPPPLLFLGVGWARTTPARPRAVAVAVAGCLGGSVPGRGRAGAVQGGGARAEGVGAGAAAARVVAERRQQVAPFPAAAVRHLGQGAAGGGVGARVCARVCSPWHRLRPPPARSRSLAAVGRPFRVSALPPLSSSSILRSRVCDGSLSCRPPVGDCSGWKETPQRKRPKGRGTGTEDTRPRDPARRDGCGAGGRLVSREMREFLG